MRLLLALLAACSDRPLPIPDRFRTLDMGSARALSFDEAIASPELGDLYHCATGDFDEDGKVDVACVVQGATSVSIGFFRGSGDGHFAAAGLSPVDGQPGYELLSADADGDGRADLFFSDQAARGVAFLHGHGDGSFSAVRYTAAEVGALAIADFDGDGRLDVVVGGGSGYVSYLAGNGDGSFLSGAGTSVPLGAPVWRVAAADFNGDGQLDLAALTSMELSLLTGDARGQFTRVQRLLVPQSTLMALADVDGDGQSDVVVLSDTSAIVFANQRGKLSQVSETMVGSFPSGVAAGDLDGDGRVDLALAIWNQDALGLLLSSGGGAFAPIVDYGGGNPTEQVMIADTNGDGTKDIITADAGRLLTLLGAGQGRLHAARSYPGGSASGDWRHIVAADLDGDGRLDLTVGSVYSLDLLVGRGDGSFDPRSLPDPGATLDLLLADLDGDGHLDAISEGGVRWGDGMAGFAPAIQEPVNGTLLAAGRFGARSQVVLCTFDGALALVGADATRVLTVENTVSFASCPRTAAAGDLDGDGVDELVVLDDSGLGVLRLGAGAPARYPLTGGQAVTLADLDADGRLDAVVAGSDGLTVWRGQGDGSFAAPLHVPQSGTWYALANADFDGDGYVDLLGLADLQAGIALGDGRGGFAALQPLVGGEGPVEGVIAADFNGDGRPDVALATDSGRVHVLFNTSR
jgi:hypothetical protein